MEELQNYLRNEVETAYDARLPLNDRWKLVKQVYDNDPAIAGTKLFDNFEPRAVPTMSPRINRIVNVTMDALTSPNPIIQATPDDQNQVAADSLEKGVQVILDTADFERVLRRGLTTTALCGVSIIRCRMTEDGLKLDHIHPHDFIVAPTYGLELKDAHLVGHRFYRPRWWVKDRVKSKVYDLINEDEADNLATTDPDIDPAGRDPGYDRTSTENTSHSDNDSIELWELLCRLVIDGQRQWYRVVFERTNGRLLSYEAYPYSRPWYFDLRFHDEEGKFWPANSVAQNIVGLCLLQSNMFNLLVAGSMATAANPTVITGGSLSFGTQKIKTLSLGQVIESPYDLKVQEIPLNFSAQYMPQAMEFIDDAIESQTGIYNQRLNADRKSGDVTATQIAAEEQAANQNEGAYPTFSADFLEKIAEFVQELVQLHGSWFRKVYQGSLLPEFFASIRAKVRWQVTGRKQGNSPHILTGKLQVALGVAANPLSKYSYQAVEEAFMKSLQLPMSVEGMEKTQDDITIQVQQLAQTMAQEMVAQSAKAPQASKPSGGGGVGGSMVPPAGMGVSA